MTITTSMRALDDTHGAIRVEEVYDTDIDDLWQACTAPERLARWIAHVAGDPGVGATVQVVFTSTWSGPVRIDACDAPHHLLLTSGSTTEEVTQIEAWLTAEDARTRLVVEERGLPIAQLHFHGAGWQVHLEDLGQALISDDPVHADGWSEQAAAPRWQQRWVELTATDRYSAMH